MLNFFHSSLDTLKQVKKPTSKEVRDVTIAIFVIVIIAAIYFMAIDGLFLNLYNMFYCAMNPSSTAPACIS